MLRLLHPQESEILFRQICSALLLVYTLYWGFDYLKSEAPISTASLALNYAFLAVVNVKLGAWKVADKLHPDESEEELLHPILYLGYSHKNQPKEDISSENKLISYTRREDKPDYCKQIGPALKTALLPNEQFSLDQMWSVQEPTSSDQSQGSTNLTNARKPKRKPKPKTQQYDFLDPNVMFSKIKDTSPGTFKLFTDSPDGFMSMELLRKIPKGEQVRVFTALLIFLDKREQAHIKLYKTKLTKRGRNNIKPDQIFKSETFMYLFGALYCSGEFIEAINSCFEEVDLNRKTLNKDFSESALYKLSSGSYAPLNNAIKRIRIVDIFDQIGCTPKPHGEYGKRFEEYKKKSKKSAP